MTRHSARIRPLALACSLASALPVRAHHGSAGVGMASPEGPGAAIETTAALPL